MLEIIMTKYFYDRIIIEDDKIVGNIININAIRDYEQFIVTKGSFIVDEIDLETIPKLWYDILGEILGQGE